MRSIPEDAPEVPMEGMPARDKAGGAEQLHQVPSLGNRPDGVFRSVRPGPRPQTNGTVACGSGRTGWRCSRGIDATGSALCCVYP
jgi:hypothetical protein